MVVTVASFKGGVGKTVTAVHLAGALTNSKHQAVLEDRDPNHAATKWAQRGPGFSFIVADHREAPRARLMANSNLLIIDTPARPETRDLEQLAENCDLIVVPTTPDVLSLDVALQTAEALETIRCRWRFLLTIVPPKPSHDGDDAAAALRRPNYPLFRVQIPRLAAFGKAALDGVLVRDAKDRRAAEAWSSYESLAREISREVKLNS